MSGTPFMGPAFDFDSPSAAMALIAETFLIQLCPLTIVFFSSALCLLACPTEVWMNYINDDSAVSSTVVLAPLGLHKDQVRF